MIPAQLLKGPVFPDFTETPNVLYIKIEVELLSRLRMGTLVW